MKWRWDIFLIPRKLLYVRTKILYCDALLHQKRVAGEISGCNAAGNTFWWRNFFQGKMSYLYRNEDVEMAPTITGKRETLLIRKLPRPEYWFRLIFKEVCVGDVVLIKNPLDLDKFLVRRLVALGGHKIVSTDKKDEPFVIDDDECWVLSDNKELKSEEANDSRSFGAVPIIDIMGRVIYRFQSMKDHGHVKNNRSFWNTATYWDCRANTQEDLAIVNFEVELDEMQKISEA